MHLNFQVVFVKNKGKFKASANCDSPFFPTRLCVYQKHQLKHFACSGDSTKVETLVMRERRRTPRCGGGGGGCFSQTFLGIPHSKLPHNTTHFRVEKLKCENYNNSALHEFS